MQYAKDNLYEFDFALMSVVWSKRLQGPKCPKRGISRLLRRSGLRRVGNGGGGQVYQSLPLVTGRVLNWKSGRTKAPSERAMVMNPKNDLWGFWRGRSRLHSPEEPTARGAQTTQYRPVYTHTLIGNISGLFVLPFVCSGTAPLRPLRRECWRAWGAGAKHQHTHHTKVSPRQGTAAV